MEGIYEYGSRAGVWRILREFEKRGLPLTGVWRGHRLAKHREVAQAFAELGHEVACHGLNGSTTRACRKKSNARTHGAVHGDFWRAVRP